ALCSAMQHGDTVLQAFLYLASIKRATDIVDLDNQLEKLEELLLQEENNVNQNWGIIHLNVAEHLIRQHSKETSLHSERDSVRRVHGHLQLAKKHLPETALRPQSQILGLRGLLYENDKRYDEALVLSRQAIELANQISAQDLLISHEWQVGRLYKSKGNRAEAIDNYRRAVSHVEAIRQDIPVRYQDGKSSFNELLGPLYQQSIDLLLQEAASKENDKQKQKLLSKVRILLEQFKQDELEDFLQDRCINRNDTKFSLDQIEVGTAVLYPILLPDRFEWLVGINNKLHQIQIFEFTDLEGNKHSGEGFFDQLNEGIPDFIKDLRGGWDSPWSQFMFKGLYKSLFKPLQSLLTVQDVEIETLVYIPDGIMRLLPLSMLQDEDKNEYLIERYAIVTVPGLSLLNARIDMPKQVKSLLVGLSVPSNEMMRNLPQSMQASREQEKFNSQSCSLDKENFQPVAVTRTSNNQHAVQDDSTRKLSELAETYRLPCADHEVTELEIILSEYQPLKLLNDEFKRDDFQKELRKNYDIVHIASHAHFDNNYKDSFIMSYDKPLELDKFEDLLGAQIQGNSINMISLSACVTAEGNDRAPLGFSGVALKANVKTVLGTLWLVDDAATAKLMKTFYRKLIKESYSKANALQEAQKELIKSEKWSDAKYWAPFILIGHWQ
ncbi:MAG: CHAT domain-containing protein, partial [Betaproteobacteria bacterium]|nr:CHAT domain-containing protein [Betaproteobacteria bacterium]